MYNTGHLINRVMRHQYLPLLVGANSDKGVLSFSCSSSMHSQSSNSGVVDVVDVAESLGPTLSVNHVMTMDRLDIIWYTTLLNEMMRHQYLPLLVTTD
jgi:hypothetical protein